MTDQDVLAQLFVKGRRTHGEFFDSREDYSIRAQEIARLLVAHTGHLREPSGDAFLEAETADLWAVEATLADLPDMCSYILKSPRGDSNRTRPMTMLFSILGNVLTVFPRLGAAHAHSILSNTVLANLPQDLSSDGAMGLLEPAFRIVELKLCAEGDVIEKMRSKIHEQLQSGSTYGKKGSSPRGRLLHLLCLLVAQYPGSCPADAPRKAWVTVVQALRDDWPTRPADYTRRVGEPLHWSIMEGCIRGLDALLQVHRHACVPSQGGRVTTPDKQYCKAEVLGAVQSALVLASLKEGRVMQGPLLAATEFLTHHAVSMSVEIFIEYFDVVLQNCHGRHRRLREASPETLMALVHVAAADIRASCGPSSPLYVALVQRRLFCMARGQRTGHLTRQIHGTVKLPPYDPMVDLHLALQCLPKLAFTITRYETSAVAKAFILDLLTRARHVVEDARAEGRGAENAERDTSDKEDSGLTELQDNDEEMFGDEVEDDKGRLDANGAGAGSSFASNTEASAASADPDKENVQPYLTQSKAARVLAGSAVVAAAVLRFLPASLLLDGDHVASEVVSVIDDLIKMWPYLRTTPTGGRHETCAAIFVLLSALADRQTEVGRTNLLDEVVERIVPSLLSHSLGRDKRDGSQEGYVGDRFLPGWRHVFSGEPDSRALFQYAPLWAELVSVHDEDTCDMLFQLHSQHRHEAVDGMMDGDGMEAAGEEQRSASSAEPVPCIGAGKLGRVAVIQEYLTRLQHVVLGALMRSCISRLLKSNLALLTAGNTAADVASSSGAQLLQVPGGAALATGEAAVLALGSQDMSGALVGGSVVVPADPLDFDQFLGLVEFFLYVVPLLPSSPLCLWCRPVLEACVEGARLNPHISGHWTVASVMLVVANSSGWFERIHPEVDDDEGDEDEGEIRSGALVGGQVAVDCVAISNALAADTIGKLRAMKGEALLAGLQYLLCLPAAVRRMSPHRLVSALRICLPAGKTQPIIAVVAITAMEELDRQKAHGFDDALPDLLPYVSDLLCITGQRAVTDSTAAGTSTETITLGVIPSGEEQMDYHDTDNPEQTESAAVAAATDTSQRKIAAALTSVLTRESLHILTPAILSAWRAGFGPDEAVHCVRGGLISQLRSIRPASLLRYSPEFATLPEKVRFSSLGAPKVSLAHGLQTPIDAYGAHETNHVQEEAVASLSLLRIADTVVTVSTLQERAAVLLGRLGGKAKYVLGTTTAALSAEMDVSSPAQNNFEVILRLPRRKPESAAAASGPGLQTTLFSLRFDCLLPRIAHLAESSLVRQVKVSACECLHASMCGILGQMASSAEQHSDGLSRFLPTMMHLASDDEPAARNLFGPFIMQLVRLCTSSLASHSSFKNLRESFIEHVSLALVDAQSRTRELAARAFGEYVTWTAKSNSEGTSDGDEGMMTVPVDGRMPRTMHANRTPAQIVVQLKPLINRLTAAARHPSPHARAGACLAWSQMYREYRQHPALVSSCHFDIIDAFFSALRASSGDAPSMGTVAAAAASVDHCLRIASREAMAAVLMVEDESRPMHAPHRLDQLVCWLFVRTCLPETQARRKAMHMFDVLAPIVQHLGSRAGAAGRTSSMPRQDELLHAWVNDLKLGQGPAQEGVVLTSAMAAMLETSVGPSRQRQRIAPNAERSASQQEDADPVEHRDDDEEDDGERSTNLPQVLSVIPLLRSGEGDFTIIRLCVSPLDPLQLDLASKAFESVVKWKRLIDALSSALDCSTWMLSREFTTSNALLGTQGGTSLSLKRSRSGEVARQESLLWSALQVFISTVMVPTGASLSWLESRAQINREILQRSRSLLLCRLFVFASALSGAAQDGGRAAILRDQLIPMVGRALSQPSTMFLHAPGDTWDADGSVGGFVGQSAAMLLKASVGMGSQGVVESLYAQFSAGETQPLRLPNIIATANTDSSALKAVFRVTNVLQSASLLSHFVETSSSGGSEWASQVAAAIMQHSGNAHASMETLLQRILTFALGCGVPWHAGLGTPGLAQILHLDSAVLNTADSLVVVETRYRQYAPAIIPHLVNARSFTNFPAEGVLGSSRGLADPRVDIRYYPVFHSLLSIIQIDGENNARKRAFAWQVLTDVCSCMISAMGTAEFLRPTAQRVAAAVVSSASESANKGASTLQVRPSVFINALVASLCALGKWSQAMETAALNESPAGSAEKVSAVTFLMRCAAAADPWLLVSAEVQVGEARNMNMQIRTLSLDAQSNALSLLGSLTLSGDSSQPLTFDQSRDRRERRVALCDILPVFLPGFSLSALLPASVVSGGELLLPEMSDIVYGRRPLSAVFPAALRLVRQIIEEMPINSNLRELDEDRNHLDEYIQYIEVLLQALVSTGSLNLLRCLSPLLREGYKHRLIARIVGSLRAFAANVATEGPAFEAVCREVLITVFATISDDYSAGVTPGSEYVPPFIGSTGLNALLVNELLIPLLHRAQSSALRHLLLDSPFFTRILRACELVRDCHGSSNWSTLASCDKQCQTLMHYLISLGGTTQAEHCLQQENGSLLLSHRTAAFSLLAAGLDALSRATQQSGLTLSMTGELKIEYAKKCTSGDKEESRLGKDLAEACSAVRTRVPRLLPARPQDAADIFRFYQACFTCLVSTARMTQKKYTGHFALVFDFNGKNWDLDYTRFIDTNVETGMPYLSSPQDGERLRSAVVDIDVAMTAPLVFGSEAFASRIYSQASQARDYLRDVITPSRSEIRSGSSRMFMGRGLARIDSATIASLAQGIGMGTGLPEQGLSAAARLSAEGFSSYSTSQAIEGTFDVPDGPVIGMGEDSLSALLPIATAPVSTVASSGSGQVQLVPDNSASVPSSSDVVSQQLMPVNCVTGNPAWRALLRELDCLSAGSVEDARLTASISTVGSMPTWMDALHKRVVPLAHSRVGSGSSGGMPPLPLRTFISMLLIARPHLFRPFAQVWAPVLMHVVCDAHELAKQQSDSNGHSGCMKKPGSFHKLMRDVATLLADVWYAGSRVGRQDSERAHAAGCPAYPLRPYFEPTNSNECDLCVRFLEIVIAASVTPQQRALQANMMIFGALIKQWGPCGVRITRHRIARLLFSKKAHSNEVDPFSVAVGAATLAYAADARQAVFDDKLDAGAQHSFTRSSFAQLIVKALAGAKKASNYTRYAALLGLFLQQADQSGEHMWLHELRTMAKDVLDTIGQSLARTSGQYTQERGYLRYLAVLYHIAQRHAEVVTHHERTQVQYVMNQARGRTYARGQELDVAVSVLQAAARGVKDVTTAIQLWEVVEHNLTDLLTTRAAARLRGATVQQRTLALIADLALFLPASSIAILFDQEQPFALNRMFLRHQDASTRKEFYRICQQILQRDAEQELGNAARIAKSAMLAALADADRVLRTEAYAYWNGSASREGRLPQDDAGARLQALLADLTSCDNQAARVWVHHAAPLMLTLLASDPDFHRHTAINARPIDPSVQFIDAPLLGNESTDREAADGSGAAMKPLFSRMLSTQGQSVMRGLRASSSRRGLHAGFLLATQVSGPMFSITQDESGAGHDTPRFSMHSFQPFAPLDVGRQALRAFPSQFGRGSVTQRVPGTLNVSQAYAHVAAYQGNPAALTSLRASQNAALQAKNPAEKSQSQITSIPEGFAPAWQVYDAAGDLQSTTSAVRLTEIEGQRKRSAARSSRQIAKTARSVRMYRIGELPDVQVAPSALLLPLQVLCELDASLAATVYGDFAADIYAAAPAEQEGGVGTAGKRSGTGNKSDRRAHVELDVLAPGARLQLKAKAGKQNDLGLQDGVTQASLRHTFALVMQHLEHMMKGFEDCDVGPLVATMHRLSSELHDKEEFVPIDRRADVRLAPAAFPIPPAILGSTALTSLSYASGIIALQQGLFLAEPAETSAVCTPGSSGATIPPNAGTSLGIKGGNKYNSISAINMSKIRGKCGLQDRMQALAGLQALYGALGEDDAVAGLARLRLDVSCGSVPHNDGAGSAGEGAGASCSQTRGKCALQALSAEHNGEFRVACDLYARLRVDEATETVRDTNTDMDDAELDELADADAGAGLRPGAGKLSLEALSAAAAHGWAQLRCLATLGEWHSAFNLLCLLLIGDVNALRSSIGVRDPGLDGARLCTWLSSHPSPSSEQVDLACRILVHRMLAEADGGRLAGNRGYTMEEKDQPGGVRETQVRPKEARDALVQALKVMYAGERGAVSGSQRSLWAALEAITRETSGNGALLAKSQSLDAGRRIVSAGMLRVSRLYSTLSPMAVAARARALSPLQPLYELADWTDLSQHNVTAMRAPSGSSFALQAESLVIAGIVPLLSSIRCRPVPGLSSDPHSSVMAWDCAALVRGAIGLDMAHTQRLNKEPLIKWIPAISRATYVAAITDISGVCASASGPAETFARRLVREYQTDRSTLSAEARRAELQWAASLALPRDGLHAEAAEGIFLVRPNCTRLSMLARDMIVSVSDDNKLGKQAMGAKIEIKEATRVMGNLGGLSSVAALDLFQEALASHVAFGRQAVAGESSLALLMHRLYALARRGAGVGVQCSEVHEGAKGGASAKSLASAVEDLRACIEGRVRSEPSSAGQRLVRAAMPAHGRLEEFEDGLGEGMPARKMESDVEGLLIEAGFPLAQLSLHASRVSRARLLLAGYGDALLRLHEQGLGQEEAGSKGVDGGDKGLVTELLDHLATRTAEPLVDSGGQCSAPPPSSPSSRQFMGSVAAMVVRQTLRAAADRHAHAHSGRVGVGVGVQSSPAPLPTHLLTLTAVTDDVCASESQSHSPALPLHTPTLLLPRVLDLAMQYEEAKRAFGVGCGLQGYVGLAEGWTSLATPPLFVWIPYLPQLTAALQLTTLADKQDTGGGVGDDARTPLTPSRFSPECTSLLCSLARVYPQAVYYNYRMAGSVCEQSWMERVDACTGAALPPPRPRLAAALSRVRNAFGPAVGLWDKWTGALQELYAPEVRIKDWADRVKEVMRKVRTAGVGRSEASGDMHPLAQKGAHEDLFAMFEGSGAEMGSKTRERWLEYKKGLVRILGSSAHPKITRETVEAVVNQMKAAKPTAFKTMSEASAWLPRFRGADVPAGWDIEVPGQYSQYDGSRPPCLSEHATVAYVLPSLTPMHSLRVPIKFVMVGADERGHSFLAKAGEDLRQDERVGRLFATAGQLWRASRAGQARGLGLRTYAVVPITAQLGLVSWVPHTLTFKSIVEGEARGRLMAAARRLPLAEQGPANSAALAWKTGECDAAVTRGKWLASFAPRLADQPRPDMPTPVGSIYGAMYRCADAENAERAWADVMLHQPPDLLRVAIAGLAPSPDAAIALRAHSLRSLASFSAASWIIGLGDRHLDNFLLDMRTGELVPIDFGHAFGSATSSLAVPELIPIRCTPALLHLAAPLPTPLLLASLMTAAMGVLREDAAAGGAGRLLSSLELFARDPTHEWQKAARMRAHLGHPTPGQQGDTEYMEEDEGVEQGSSALSNVGTVYSRAKLLLAALKLRGGNPAPLLFLDILSNPNIINPNVRGRPGVSKEVSLLETHKLKGPDAAARLSTAEGIKRVVFAMHRDSMSQPRTHTRNTQPLPMSLAEQALLVLVLGGPLQGNPEGILADALDLPGQGLTACCNVREQVHALLDLSADPNVLVRQFAGLGTWI